MNRTILLLLVSLVRLHPRPGNFFKLDTFRDYSLACARDGRELSFFASCLLERGDLAAAVSGDPGYTITLAGWERAGQLLVAEAATARTAFVAMQFNEDMLQLWKAAFAPAIQRAGFQPRLANDPAHNERIDARIVAEIKQCRFVVADVTGARTGVYFEAGYALGLGRPVIWTCRRSRMDADMHFDTRQYNHILWDESADLCEQLYYRILASI